LKITTKKKKFTNPLYLESGRILEPYELMYETYGKLNSDKSNVIVVCHALTGSHHCAGHYEGERKAGWWDDMIGDGKTIDTSRYFIICVNVLGSCFGSTGPMSLEYPSFKPFRFKFPVVTIKDMVKAQKILFDSLGIYKAKVVIGGSMGGMQSLVFGVEYPKFAEEIVVLASTYATQPWAIAFNKVSREAIIRDPDFKDGYYSKEDVEKKKFSGLSIGRMNGYISYLSPNSMEEKFGRKHVETDGLYELFGRFQIERYLDYNGYNFPKWFDPLSYLYITKAINIFDVASNYDSLEEAFGKIEANLTLISFEGDMLFLPKEMQVIEDSMKKIGKEEIVTHHLIKSDYGHDAFLVELGKFDFYIQRILNE